MTVQPGLTSRRACGILGAARGVARTRARSHVLRQGTDSQLSTPVAHGPTVPSAVAFVASTIGIIVAVLALPVVLLLGGPAEGWMLGVVLWCVNWAGHIFTAKAAQRTSAVAAVGMSGVSFISRAWLTAIILFIVALKYSETVGLTAAAVFLVAFTCDLMGRTILFATTQKQMKAAEL